MDAIFWVACSAGPWRALPNTYGNANSAHRMLARLAHNGVLDRLLIAASRHPMAFATLRSLEWRIVRAWRRACRILSVESLALARRLGLLSALPAAPWYLPNPDLLPTLWHEIRMMFLQDTAGRPRRCPPKAELDWLSRLHRLIGGRPSAFRTTEPPGLAAPGVR
jgi:transposase